MVPMQAALSAWIVPMVIILISGCVAAPSDVENKLFRDTKGKHELRKSQPDMVLHDPALLFAAGILWEQASDGRRKPLPEV